MTRRGAELWLAAVFAAAILVVSIAVLSFVLTISPAHTDPATVPSTAAAAAQGRERYARAVEESQRLARTLLVDENLAGLSVAVAVDGETVWDEGFGWADVERRAPVTPLTRFRLGSVSKTLTAAAVALLYDRRRIDLDAPVQRYVPAYPEKPWTVTIRHLLGDIAGIHRIRGDNNDLLPGRHCTSLSDALTVFADEPLLFRPGTQYRFSTYGWVLLSAVIEGAAQEPYQSFIRRELLEPLGMDRTVLEGSGRIEDVTSFYFPRMAMRTGLGLQDAPAGDYSCYAGAGAFLSTPSNLVRFQSAMLRPGLLKAETIALMHTPLQLESGASTDFALGWRVEDVQLAGSTTRMLIHRGSPAGGTISLMMFPELQLVVATTSNVSHSSGVWPFGRQVAEVFAQLVREGLRETPPEPQVPERQRLLPH